MENEIEMLAESFCEECLNDVLTCGWDIKVNDFICKVADLMKAQANHWQPEEEEK